MQRLPIPVAILSVSFILFMVAQSAYGQQDHQMDMNETITTSSNATSAESSMTFDIADSNVQVKLSWQPGAINTDEPTAFTFEFLDSTTGERLRDVAYSVHLLVDDKSVVHGHEDTAPDGIGTMEQQFDSMGALSIIVDTITVGSDTVDGFAQFNTNVVPEFPLLIVGAVMSAGLISSIVAPRFFFKKG